MENDGAGPCVRRRANDRWRRPLANKAEYSRHAHVRAIYGLGDALKQRGVLLVIERLTSAV